MKIGFLVAITLLEKAGETEALLHVCAFSLGEMSPLEAPQASE